MGLTRACTLLADETDMCCAVVGDCTGAEDSAPGTPPASLTAWLAAPGVQGTYSADEYVWLTAARAALVEAHDEIVANVCGAPVGVCSTVLRPCLPCYCRRCSLCGSVAELDLAEVIDGDILDVTIDVWTTSNDIDTPDETWTLGDELRIEGGTRLVAQGCPDEPETLACWPTQDRSRPVGCASTWRITVVHGTTFNDYETPDDRYVRGVPGWLRAAIGDLACIKLNRCLPADRCSTKLPDNTKSTSSQGITVAFVTELDYTKAGLSGVRSVDKLQRLVHCDDPGLHDVKAPVFGFADPTGATPALEAGAEFIVVSTRPGDDPSTVAVEGS